MRIIIAFDDHINNELKRLFQECSDNARQISVAKNIDHILIDSSILNKDDVINVIQNQGKEEFLFAAFSHGNENALHCTDVGSYLDTNTNLDVFRDKIVYTYACDAGVRLGQVLIDNGARAFIGYTNKVWTTFESIEIVADCATYGIDCILEGEGLNECIELMRGKYTREYKKTLESGDILGAGFLLDSREALVLLSTKKGT